MQVLESLLSKTFNPYRVPQLPIEKPPVEILRQCPQYREGDQWCECIGAFWGAGGAALKDFHGQRLVARLLVRLRKDLVPRCEAGKAWYRHLLKEIAQIIEADASSWENATCKKFRTLWEAPYQRSDVAWMSI